MNSFLKLRLYEEAFTGDNDDRPVIINPLAISSIELKGDFDIVTMQNGDKFNIVHTDTATSQNPWSGATSLLSNALQLKIKK